METQGPRLHVPVMVSETLELLRARTLKCCIFVDMTVGTGGHTEALLKHAPRSTVIGFDLDASSLDLAKKRLVQYADRLLLIHGDYRDVASHLGNLGITAVDGCLIDAGMSLWQVDCPERGISFRHEAFLDMRYDRTDPNTPTAAQLIHTLTAEQLYRLFYEAGETGWARSIADNIVRLRRRERITTTSQLAAIVEATIPARVRAQSKIHPVTRVFAALRQAVNGELDAIHRGLIAAAKVTAVNGHIVILTYSSSEDRIAKTTLRGLSARHEATRGHSETVVAPSPPEDLSTPPADVMFSGAPVLRVLTRKPLTPSLEEKRANPRCRSAKLRAAEVVRRSER